MEGFHGFSPKIAETTEHCGCQPPHRPAGVRRPGRPAAGESLAAAPFGFNRAVT